MTRRIAIVGAGGYTGIELMRLLFNHPRAEITCLTSLEDIGEPVSKSFPSLLDRIPVPLETLDVEKVAAKADIVFTALPHKAAMGVVPGFLKAGKKVIDLSADYRLQNIKVYEQWYQTHTSPELVPEAAYGLPELYRERVRGARLVANPGCYPTSAVLALAPLARDKMIDPETLIIDSKSGATGAGRSVGINTLFCEVNEGFKAYGVGSHRHTPEIEQVLGDLFGAEVRVNFTPHLLPINRGILSTSYAKLTRSCTTEELLEVFGEFYRDEPFVRVLPAGRLPNVAAVRGSNFCDVGLVCDPRTGRVIVVSAIDNLVKGASGQAVQNMNLMEGFEETLGLDILPLFP
ncbi:MAG: N-acetyl-gamma-glutamyl-phosphate reductase [Deltaproteobacteria bacterium]|nr:N-acetyl-gamma-glutamyl-phosphate reductase [Deltaproteobacteria bacterium]